MDTKLTWKHDDSVRKTIIELETQIILETSILIWKHRVKLGDFTVDGRTVKPWRYFDGQMILDELNHLLELYVHMNGI